MFVAVCMPNVLSVFHFVFDYDYTWTECSGISIDICK